MLWGLALSTKAFGKHPRPAWLLDLHRFLGGLALVFIGIHIATIVADTYVHFGIVEILVPFTASYHPVAVAWGIVALYLLGAVEVTSLLRHRLSKRVWRTTHYASFPVFVLTTVHGLWAGTDRNTPALHLGMILVSVAVVALIAIRVYQAESDNIVASRPGAMSASAD